jgi:hypothetical protein
METWISNVVGKMVRRTPECRSLYKPEHGGMSILRGCNWEWGRTVSSLILITQNRQGIKKTRPEGWSAGRDNWCSLKQTLFYCAPSLKWHLKSVFTCPFLPKKAIWIAAALLSFLKITWIKGSLNTQRMLQVKLCSTPPHPQKKKLKS